MYVYFPFCCKITHFFLIMLINIPLSLIFLLFLSFQLLIGDICYFPIVFTELGISIDVYIMHLGKFFIQLASFKCGSESYFKKM